VLAASYATLRAGVYQGSAVDALIEVAGGTTPLTFTAVPGETYRIAVDSAGDESFSVRLNRVPDAITNDAFAAATELAGPLVEVQGSTAGATLEPGEPYHTGSTSQGGSTWWRWTAPVDGAVAVSASGVSTTWIAIYQGDGLGTLVPVAGGAGAGAFQATAGVSYRIATSATNSTGYPFDLRLEQAGTPPANDAFANAALLPARAAVAGTTTGASREVGEPWHASSQVVQTVWYRWTAPASGRARVTVSDGKPGALVIYRGDSPAGLQEVLAAVTDAGFAVSAGEEFRIMVGLGSGGVEGAFQLAVGMMDPGGNDAFANRVDLGSVWQVDWSGTLEGSTLEAGESPYESGGRGSLWWSWTAPADGGLSFEFGSGRIVPGVYVYTGDSLATLQLAASSGYSSRMALPVREGTTYHIALRGAASATGIGDFQASLRWQAQPNDALERSAGLAGVLPVSASAPLAGATYLWWEWVAPISGTVEIDFGTTGFPTNPAVFTGPGRILLDSVSLTRVNDSVSRFAVVAGTRYWIRTGPAQSNVFGPVWFELREPTELSNDLFANALLVTGDAIGIDTVNFGATDEPGEPLPTSRPYTYSYQKSLWWKWVAPRTGLLRVTITSGWAFLYEGASWEELREVAGPAAASSTSGAYWVEAGREYHLAAGNSGAGRVAVVLEMSPAGDFFSGALDLGSSSWLKRDGSLAGCFWEPGEPLHHGSAAQTTLWFNWLAPTSGNYRLVARSGATALRAAVYFGDTITGLRQLGSGSGGFSFPVDAGRVVRIVIDGGTAAGDYELLLEAELPGYADWRDLRFDIMDPSSAPDADPDLDGRTNLLEFALGSEPREFSPGPGFTVDDADGAVRLNVRRPNDCGGWQYSFELSPGLTGWQGNGQLNRIETVEEHGDGTETLHVVLPDFLYAEHPALFFRLRVSGN
jgi:hypothetical protein